MQVVPRWRNLFFLRNSLTYSSTQFASFHSTPVSNEKWKKKWNSDFRSGQQPSKNFIRYATRQKRADAKRALKDLLFNSGAFVQDKGRTWKMDGANSWDAQLGDDLDNSNKKWHSKSSSRHAQRAQKHRTKRESKFRREFFSEDDDHPETIFNATFGNRWYTWAFNSWHSSAFQSSTAGFHWKEDSTDRDDQYEESDTSETKSDDEACYVGFHSDRRILGLPLNGPLAIEDVKNAFRLSALKWHPDKHQGPSQAAAEEKFKQCVNAYKSLCGALSAA